MEWCETQGDRLILCGGLADVPRGSILERYEAPSSLLLSPSSHVSDVTDEAEQDLSQMVLSGSRRGGKGKEEEEVEGP